jgi:DNA (cytosine-5)-methyltransferase 1
MTKLRVLDLFSGIGGFSLGLERTGGFETVAFCEIEPFPRRVLAKHWPKVPIYDDVRTLTAERLAADGIAVDVICGGFPCQDISIAGAQGGLDAERSGLWSEIARLAGEIRPRLVIVENVANLLAGPSERPGWWFGRVLGDLAALGYDAEWHGIPASAVGAEHDRDRVWIVAHLDPMRELQPQGREQDQRRRAGDGVEAPAADADQARHQGGCKPERTIRMWQGSSRGCDLPSTMRILYPESTGIINPSWAEGFMGFPIGWTELDASETRSTPKSPK